MESVPIWSRAVVDITMADSFYTLIKYRKTTEKSRTNLKNSLNITWIIHKIATQNTYLSENIKGSIEKSHEK
jgi:hypothetical protein